MITNLGKKYLGKNEEEGNAEKKSNFLSNLDLYETSLEISTAEHLFGTHIQFTKVYIIVTIEK